MQNDIPLILLAGGKSSRMGLPKGLVKHSGHYWLERQLETFSKAGGKTVVLVLGYEFEAYQKVLIQLKLPLKLYVTVNEHPEYGPFSSIQTGLKWVFENINFEKVFILPIDVPAPTTSVWDKLESEIGNVNACVPVFKDQGGHPALLSKKYCAELLNLSPDDRLDFQLRGLSPELLKRVPVEDQNSVLNLNTPSDFNNLDPSLILGKDAAILSVVEVGLGSFLHAFKVPLSGDFLSLNQIFLISRSVLNKDLPNLNARCAPFTISIVTSMLKSLSPAGKKLTPMLAISAQGSLFSMGTLVFGPNLIGAAIGASLSSIWSFAQPLLLYSLIFGKNLISALHYFYETLHRFINFDEEDVLKILIGLVFLKMLLAIGTVFLARLLPHSTFIRYQEKMKSYVNLKENKSNTGEKDGIKNHVVNAFKDLLNPFFILSIFITGFFFYISESSMAGLVWVLLRPVAMGFIVFFAIRTVAWHRLLFTLEKRGFYRFSRVLKVASNSLNNLIPTQRS